MVTTRAEDKRKQELRRARNERYRSKIGQRERKRQRERSRQQQKHEDLIFLSHRVDFLENELQCLKTQNAEVI